MRKRLFLIGALILALGLTGCGNNSKKENQDIESKEEITLFVESKEKEVKDISNSEEYLNLIKEYTNTMGKNMYNGSGNLSYSPIGAQVASTNFIDFSRGDSRQALYKELGIKPDDSLSKENVILKSKLTSKEGINMADGIWVNSEIKEFNIDKLKEKAEKSAADLYFGAFDKEGNERYNKWQEDNLEAILNRDGLKEDTRIMVTNALRFKNNWEVEFDKNETEKSQFSNFDKSKTEVDFMKDNREVQYFENKEFKSIGLEFKDSDAVGYFILPNDMKNQGKIFDNLYENLTEIDKEKVSEKVEFKIPRFHLNLGGDITKSLNSGKFELMFKDFTTDVSKDGIMRLYQLNQFIDIKVDEEGSEAKALTEGLEKSSMPLEPKEIAFDKPFIYVIVEKDEKSENIIPLFVTYIGNIANDKSDLD